jgi:hypothetical protein
MLLSIILWQVNATAQLTYETLRVVYDSTWTYKNLQLIPVRFKQPNTPAPLTSKDSETISFSEALRKGMVKVKEIQFQKGSDVNLLEVTNKSKHQIMVNSGEMLSGGKQDRMIGETKMIAPGKGKQYLKVFCIEKGRWDNKSKPFKYRGRANSELRKTMDVTGRQSAIWKEIDKGFTTSKEVSQTRPFLQLFKDSIRADTGYLNFFMRKYRQSDSLFAGFIAVTANKIISCELYANTDLTHASFPAILNGFIFSAKTNGDRPVMPHARVKGFTDKFLISEPVQRAYIPAHGKFHKVNNKIIHLTAYDD